MGFVSGCLIHASSKIATQKPEAPAFQQPWHSNGTMTVSISFNDLERVLCLDQAVLWRA